MTRKECFAYLKDNPEVAKEIFEFYGKRYQNLSLVLVENFIIGDINAKNAPKKCSLWQKILNWLRK